MSAEIPTTCSRWRASSSRRLRAKTIGGLASAVPYNLERILPGPSLLRAADLFAALFTKCLEGAFYDVRLYGVLGGSLREFIENSSSLASVTFAGQHGGVERTRPHLDGGEVKPR